jgi:hypothetical protein
LTASSILEHLPDGLSNDLHLSKCESIPTRKVARRTGRRDVAFDVRLAVVNSVQPTRQISGSAMNAWLHDKGQYLGSRHVAGINSLVGFAQKHGAAFVRFGVLLIACLCLGALLVSHLAPSITSVVAATLALFMALAALIGKAQRTAFVSHEEVGCCWQHLAAPMALASGVCVVGVAVHSPIIKTFRTL